MLLSVRVFGSFLSGSHERRGNLTVLNKSMLCGDVRKAKTVSDEFIRNEIIRSKKQIIVF